jgi:FAD/FMN-containing dehydrogenase
MAELGGTVYRREDEGYDAARRATVWNARIPDRFPDLVVRVGTVEDVQRAVRHAAREGLTVGIRSGGHSWSANHVRDGGMLLDLSELRDVVLDVENMAAQVGPGTRGHELCAVLEEQGLFFPAGHCKGVAVGGYLLQGGYGWNSRRVGPACESVTAVDVVTADGELVHADHYENADLFWAARGSGPGFFGVVVRFHLTLYPQPPVSGMSTYLYPLDQMDEVYAWAHRIGPEVDRRVELQMLMSRSFPAAGVEEPAIAIGAPVFADTEEEARQAVALLDTCPVRGRALVAEPFLPMPLQDWYSIVMEEYPDGHRYATDNMWTSAPVEDLLPGLHRIADGLPPAPSHCLWLNWGPSPKRQDMAYSVEDDIYLALYGMWADPADDDRYADWAVSNMRSMEPLATGVQLADENLGERPARFATDDAMARLDEIRARWDPTGRFHSWMGRR